MRDYKLVVLGAGGVGKSCLTVQFVQGVYIDVYDPTIEDSYSKTMDIDGKLVELEILDTAGVQQFTAMRELYIKSGHGFLLVYSVDDKNSLSELLKLREQVLRIKNTDKVPMVLVGNKADLSDLERKISVEDGISVSDQWGKIPFYETSALLRSNVDEVFVDLVRQIIRNEIEEQKKLHHQQQQFQKPVAPKGKSSYSQTHSHSGSTASLMNRNKSNAPFQIDHAKNTSNSSLHNKPYNQHMGKSRSGSAANAANRFVSQNTVIQQNREISSASYGGSNGSPTKSKFNKNQYGGNFPQDQQYTNGSQSVVPEEGNRNAYSSNGNFQDSYANQQIRRPTSSGQTLNNRRGVTENGKPSKKSKKSKNKKGCIIL